MCAIDITACNLLKQLILRNELISRKVKVVELSMPVQALASSKSCDADRVTQKASIKEGVCSWQCIYG